MPCAGMCCMCTASGGQCRLERTWTFAESLSYGSLSRLEEGVVETAEIKRLKRRKWNLHARTVPTRALQHCAPHCQTSTLALRL